MKNWWVATVGLALMLPLVIGVLRGWLTLEAAALRSLVLLGLLVAFEQIVIPIAKALVGPQVNRRRS